MNVIKHHEIAIQYYERVIKAHKESLEAYLKTEEGKNEQRNRVS